MAGLGTLSLDVVAQTMPFERSLGRAQKKTKGFANTIRTTAGGAIGGLHSAFGRLGTVIGSTTGQLGMLGGAAGIGGLTAFSIKAAADLETTTTQFATMLGSAEKADKIVSKLFDFSKKTPFEPDEIFGAGKGLLGAGFREDEIMDPLRRLGDIASGSGARLEDLVRIFGKVKATGKVGLETLNQLAERNAVSYNDLAKSMGVTTVEMTKMISAGKVGLPEITAAIKMLTDEGGKFNGGMEAQSKTLNGLISTLKGLGKSAAAEFGTAVTGATDLKGAIAGLNKAMEETDFAAYGEKIHTIGKSAARKAENLSLGRLYNDRQTLNAEVIYGREFAERRPNMMTPERLKDLRLAEEKLKEIDQKIAKILGRRDVEDVKEQLRGGTGFTGLKGNRPESKLFGIGVQGLAAGHEARLNLGDSARAGLAFEKLVQQNKMILEALPKTGIAISGEDMAIRFRAGMKDLFESSVETFDAKPGARMNRSLNESKADPGVQKELQNIQAEARQHNSLLRRLIQTTEQKQEIKQARA